VSQLNGTWFQTELFSHTHTQPSAVGDFSIGKNTLICLTQVLISYTFDLMVRSVRLAAAAAILRMSGLLLDFMISDEISDSFFNDKSFGKRGYLQLLNCIL
jgi:hypothetical protein